MDDSNIDADAKVKAIFTELVGDRVTRLDGATIAEPAMTRITTALVEQYGVKNAADLGFPMADWNSDAAFIVALHLFPERFTDEEIADGIRDFLTHAPNHIRAACGITGHYVWTDFSESDEGAADKGS